MGSFFGFIDKGFREYDFYIGMLDAWDYVNTVVEKSGSKIHNLETRTDDEWKPFHCLKNFVIKKDLDFRCNLRDENGKLRK